METQETDHEAFACHPDGISLARVLAPRSETNSHALRAETLLQTTTVW